MYWFFFSLFSFFWILNVFLVFHVSHSFVSRQVPTTRITTTKKQEQPPEAGFKKRRRNERRDTTHSLVNLTPCNLSISSYKGTAAPSQGGGGKQHPPKGGGGESCTPTRERWKAAPPRRGEETSTTPKKDRNTPRSTAHFGRGRTQRHPNKGEENSTIRGGTRKHHHPHWTGRKQHQPKGGGKKTTPRSTGRGEQQHPNEGGRERRITHHGKGRKQHHPKEGEAYNTTQKEEGKQHHPHGEGESSTTWGEGIGDATPTQKKEDKGNHHSTFYWPHFVLICFNLSYVNSNYTKTKHHSQGGGGRQHRTTERGKRKHHHQKERKEDNTCTRVRSAAKKEQGARTTTTDQEGGESSNTQEEKTAPHQWKMGQQHQPKQHRPKGRGGIQKNQKKNSITQKGDAIVNVKDNDKDKVQRPEQQGHMIPITGETTTQEPTTPEALGSNFPMSLTF